MIFRKTSNLSWGALLVTGALLGTLSACGGGGGTIPDPTPDPEETTGQVTITPDWGSLTAPASVRFLFYPASGTAISKDCDATGFKGELKTGTYKVLSYNADARNVTFENTDSYATATVRVKPAEALSRASSLISQPGEVYSLSAENVVVEKNGTFAQKLTPRNLAKTLRVNLTVENATFVNALSGSLNGLYSAALLATGLPTAEAITNASATATAFSLPLNGSAATADLKTLGIRNPENGTAYACLLTLYVESKQGSKLTSNVDISKEITQILDASGGTLPEGTPARIDLRVTVAETMEGITATVTIIDWSAGESGSVIL